MTPQLPLCRRLICGVPNVLPRLLPQAEPLTAQTIEPEFHSPITMFAALVSVKLAAVGFVTSSA